MKDGLVRADDLPLVFRVPGTESLPRGSRVRVRVAGTDLLTLDLHATLLARLDVTAAAAAAPEAEAEVAYEDTDEEAEIAGPLTLAIDLDEPAPAVEPPAPAPV
jgi:exoribonuclease II